MNREYIAFISYRHCPLDIAVAEQLHRQIERYTIPKELRKNEEKHLGLVFRDLDELPLSCNLSDDIYDALDHSQFLIVICTPDTPKSAWVQREIEYFISKHGHDRVLTVHAAGSAEEAIPDQVTHVYDADGQTVLREIEPLSARIVAPTQQQTLRNLRNNKEFLRLAAAMLGCPYDALYQRHKRYRMQQLSIALGILFFIAMCFTSLALYSNYQISQRNQEITQKNDEITDKNQEILDKNKEITGINQQLQDQLIETLKNESTALALLSAQQLADGDRRGAIKSALAALPSTTQDRPYSAEADHALNNALYTYQDAIFAPDIQITQSTDIHSASVSKDGRYAITVDSYGCLRGFELQTGQEIWQYQLPPRTYSTAYNIYYFRMLQILHKENTVLYADTSRFYVFSLTTGELLFYQDFPKHSILGVNGMVLSPDQKTLAVFAHDTNSSGEVSDIDNYIYFYDTADPSEDYYGRVFYSMPTYQLSNAFFSPDGQKLIVPYTNYKTNTVYIKILDTATGEVLQEYAHSFEDDIDSVQNDDVNLNLLSDDSLLLYTTQSYKDQNNRTAYQFELTHFTEDGQLLSSQKYDYELFYSPLKLCSIQTDQEIVYYHHAQIVIVDRTTGQLLLHTATSTNDLITFFTDSSDRAILVFENGELHWINHYGFQTLDDYPDYQRSIYMAHGEKDPDILWIIPKDQQNLLLVSQEIQDHNKIMLTDPLASDSMMQVLEGIYPFPAGDRFLVYDKKRTYLFNAYQKLFTIYDANTLQEIERFSIEPDVIPDNADFCGVSSDGSQLLFDGFLYDLDTHTAQAMQDMELIYENDSYSVVFHHTPWYQHQAGIPVITAYYDYGENSLYWWKDGGDVSCVPVPYDRIHSSYDSSGIDSTIVGSNGLIVMRHYDEDYDEERSPQAYLIYSITSGSWCRLDNPSTASGTPYIAAATDHPWIALADHDNVLRIYDPEKDMIVKSIPLSMSLDGIANMQFILDDKVLILVHNDYQLFALDVATGATLATHSLYRPEPTVASSTVTVEYYIQADEPNNDLYLSAHSLYETIGLRIDMDSWTVTAEIPQCMVWLPTEYIIRVNNDENHLLAFPTYDLKQLIAMGNHFVAPDLENETLP